MDTELPFTRLVASMRLCLVASVRLCVRACVLVFLKLHMIVQPAPGVSTVLSYSYESLSPHVGNDFEEA